MTTAPQPCADCDRATLTPWWTDRDGKPAHVCWDCLTAVSAR